MHVKKEKETISYSSSNNDVTGFLLYLLFNVSRVHWSFSLSAENGVKSPGTFFLNNSAVAGHTLLVSVLHLEASASNLPSTKLSHLYYCRNSKKAPLVRGNS